MEGLSALNKGYVLGCLIFMRVTENPSSIKRAISHLAWIKRFII